MRNKGFEVRKNSIRKNGAKRFVLSAVLTLALVFALPFGAAGVFADGRQDDVPAAGADSLSVLKMAQDVAVVSGGVAAVSAFAAGKTVKVKWNANGGKIGSKKTVTTKVKKGKKLGKLKVAKRSNYTFKGWYTKKSGGKKVTKNTKVKKNITLYARWAKDASNDNTNPAIPKELVGDWFLGSASGNYYDGNGNYIGVSGIGAVDTFNADGTFVIALVSTLGYSKYEQAYMGKFRVKGATIECYSVTFESRTNGKITEPNQTKADISFQFRVGSDDEGEYFMENFAADGTRTPITDENVKWRRAN